MLCISPFFNRATEPRRRADVVRGSFREEEWQTEIVAIACRLVHKTSNIFICAKLFSFSGDVYDISPIGIFRVRCIVVVEALT